MIQLIDVYEREQDLFVRYKGIEFDFFDYSAFRLDIDRIALKYEKSPRFVSAKQVDHRSAILFTQKTLEFCVLHLLQDQKFSEGADLEYFEEKCRQIQKDSCFESTDGDKVIDFGKIILKKQYQANMLKNGLSVEQECLN